MLICDAKRQALEAGKDRLKDCMKLASTVSFLRKVDRALAYLCDFFARAEKPCVACGGGKDSTAIAILARKVQPDCMIVCGDPPNPLSDREKHLQDLFAWLGGPIERVPYRWDVEAVLAGKISYPDGLKMKVLAKWQAEHMIDGVVLGIRQAESRCRRLVLKSKGAIYQTQAGLRCCPVGNFSAQEVLAVALMHDAPINPVYTRQTGACSFEHIRDGTWWPHSIVDRASWMRHYYPEHYHDYLRAVRIYDCQKSAICVF